MKNKVKISISITKDLVDYLNNLNLNKSKFIEKLINDYKKQKNNYDTN